MERINTEQLDLERTVSISFTAISLLLFVWFYDMARGFSGRASELPTLIFQVGIVISSLLLFFQTIVPKYFPRLQSGGSDRAEYLKGGESRFTFRQRLIRFGVFVAGVVVFFAIASWNFLAAMVVTYPGMVYSLDVRDPKTLIASTVVLVSFVYVVFILVLEIPLGVF